MITKLLEMFNDTRWMLPQAHLDNIVSLLSKKITNQNIEKLVEVVGVNHSKDVEDYKPEIKDGVLLFPIVGTLVPKVGWLDTMCGFNSTIKLAEDFQKITENPVGFDRIMLYVSCVGGAATGIPEFAELIHSASKRFNMATFTEDVMTSAGYYVGSATGKIITTYSALVGSIGVRTEIVKFNEEGVDTYVFTSGPYKAAGHPSIEITDEEKRYFQEGVNQCYETFLNAVSTFMKIDKEELRDTGGAYGEAMYNKMFTNKLVLSLREALNEI